jgi:hypothetical protein
MEAIEILEIIGWSLAILIMLYGVIHKIRMPFRFSKNLKREKLIKDILRYDFDVRQEIINLIEAEFEIEKKDQEE